MFGMMVASLAAAAALTGCDGAGQVAGPSPLASPCERLVGIWRSGNSAFEISRDGSVYTITSGGQTFAGPCTDGIIATGTYIGNLSYLQSADQVLLGGQQYARSSEQAEAQRAAELQAAEIARQQAREAEARAAEARAAERYRLSSISTNVTNCWNNYTCEQLSAAYSATPNDVENAWQTFFRNNRISDEAIARRKARGGPMPGVP